MIALFWFFLIHHVSQIDMAAMKQKPEMPNANSLGGTSG